MLFSHSLDNASKFSELADCVSIEKCYRGMCQKMLSLAGHARNVTRTKHSLHHNHNRIRWKGGQTGMTHRLPHQKPANHRTLTPHSINAFILLFIVLLSHDQLTTVNGASSRDSFNSIYQSNNLSVNNVITDSRESAASGAGNVNDIDDGLPIVDIEYFSNVTDEAELEKILSKIEYSNGRKLKRSPIYQNEFAVYVPNGIDVADGVASKHGFTNMGQVSRNLNRIFSVRLHEPQTRQVYEISFAIHLFKWICVGSFVVQQQKLKITTIKTIRINIQTIQF